MMTVTKLIEALQELEYEYGDAEVRLAFQPSWPLQFNLSRTIVSPLDLEDEEEDDEPAEGDEPKRSIVYLAEAGQPYETPYVPGVVSRALGWR